MTQHQKPGITVLPITQATTATFADLYISNTSLFFIKKGSKRVELSKDKELIGNEGDMMVFSPDSIVTMENRIWSGADYQAIGLIYANELVEQIYPRANQSDQAPSAQVVSLSSSEQSHILETIEQANSDLPLLIQEHRLLEILVWLKSKGVLMSSARDTSPLGQVRALIESDLTHPWRSKEVADHFAMSEATLRRWLAQSGGNFSSILSNARLEKGLSLLQTTSFPISQIALDCGFKTPSHFSDSFKTRFGIPPKSLRAPKT